MGVPGLPGAAGLTGTQGLQGIPGLTIPGEDGEPGETGPPGASGLPGATGATGSAGNSGPPGEVGDDGEAGIPGPQGLSGLPGVPGLGIPGDDGEQGESGPPGRDGTSGSGSNLTVQDEGSALTQRSILNVISAIAQAGDAPASTRTDLYVHARHYDAIVDSNQATLLESSSADVASIAYSPAVTLAVNIPAANAAYPSVVTLTVNIPTADTDYGGGITVNDDGGNLAVGETALTVSDGTNVEVNDILIIEAEKLKVTAKAVNDLTVIRAVAGTIDVVHVNGVAVRQSGTSFVYTSAGDDVEVNDILLIDNEKMKATLEDTVNNILTVVRGVAATGPATHAAAASVLQSGTSFVYLSAGDPVTVNDTVKIDSEKMNVTLEDTANDILTVDRGYSGSVAATHAAAAAVQNVVAATTTTLTRTGAAWIVDQWEHYRLVITSGSVIGQSRQITSNTSDTLTFPTLTGLNAAPSYEIIPDTNCFRRLRDAIASAARSIFYRTGVDTGTVNWLGSDALAELVGDSSNKTAISFTLSVDKSDVALFNLGFIAGSQLIFSPSGTTIQRVLVRDCTFDTLSATAVLVVGTLVKSQFFGCLFKSLIGAAFVADLITPGTVNGVALIACTFDECVTAPKLIDTSISPGNVLAVVSCLFNACTNGANLIDTGGGAEQIFTANRFIGTATGPTTMLNNTGGRCQIVGNFVRSAGAETTLFNLASDNSVNGNLVLLGDKAAGTHTAFNVQARNNFAANFVIGPVSKSGTATGRMITLGSRGNIVSTNSFFSLANSITGAYQVINIASAGRNWIITGNTFVSTGAPAGLTGIVAGSTRGALDGNIWESGASGDTPGSWQPISAVSGFTNVGLNNIGLNIVREEVIRDIVEHWEGTAYLPAAVANLISNYAWTQVSTGVGSGVATLAGAGRSAIQLTAGAAVNANALIDLRPANITESPTLGTTKILTETFIIRMNQTTNARVWLGFWDAATVGNTNPANFIGFFLDTAVSANWQLLRVVAAGAPALTSTGIAVDTNFHVFTLRRPENTGTGFVELWIDNARVVNFTVVAASVPAVDLTIGMKVLAVAVDDVTMDIDLTSARVRVS